MKKPLSLQFLSNILPESRVSSLNGAAPYCPADASRNLRIKSSCCKRSFCCLTTREAGNNLFTVW